VGPLIEWLADALVLFLIIRAIMRLVTGGRPKRAPRPAPRTAERAGGTLVRDPQCGTYVPESRAVRAGAGANLLYFCSTGCRDAYQAASRAAAGAGSEPSASASKP
jgi:hypothetical protein